jgi:hypothetical protein
MSNAITRTLCRLLGHRRLRTKVWHDGVDYRAPCARCGAPLVRDVNGDWRPFDFEKDAPAGSQIRSARPRHENHDA